MGKTVVLLLMVLGCVGCSHAAQHSEQTKNPGQHPTWIPTPEEREALQIPGPEEVFIGRFGVTMPLGRILLARKGQEYCAFMFTNTWLGETRADRYTSYEFYHQGDGSGNFRKDNVRSEEDELFSPQIQMWMGLYYSKRERKTIQCGRMKLHWVLALT